MTALARLSILQFYLALGIMQGMARPGPKPKTLDPNQFAAAVLEAVTGEPAGGSVPKEETGPAKDPAAVALGRKGGLKGGPARAKKLGKKKLSEAGKKAAAARWGKG